MRKIRNVISLIVILVLAVNINGFAQDTPKGLKEAKEKVSDKDAVEKKAEYTKAEQQELEAAAKKKKKEAKGYTNMSEDQMMEYKEKFKNASPEEQRRMEEELMAKQKQLKSAKKDKKGEMKEAKRELKEGMKGEKRELKESMKEQKREMKDEMKEAKNKGKAYGKNKGDLEGREFGQARAADAKKRIEKEESEMAERDEYVVRSKKHIAAAKKSLQDQIDAGNVSEEDIVAKQARIDRAEQRLKDFENRIIDGKQKLSNYKNNVSDIYENQ